VRVQVAGTLLGIDACPPVCVQGVSQGAVTGVASLCVCAERIAVWQAWFAGAVVQTVSALIDIDASLEVGVKLETLGAATLKAGLNVYAVCQAAKDVKVKIALTVMDGGLNSTLVQVNAGVAIKSHSETK